MTALSGPEIYSAALLSSSLEGGEWADAVQLLDESCFISIVLGGGKASAQLLDFHFARPTPGNFAATFNTSHRVYR